VARLRVGFGSSLLTACGALALSACGRVADPAVTPTFGATLADAVPESTAVDSPAPSLRCATHGWEAGPSLITARAAPQIVPLDDGDALVISGWQRSKAYPYAGDWVVESERYDHSEGRFVPAATLPWTAAAEAPYLAKLRDGRVMGLNRNGAASSPFTAFIWDPATDAWSELGLPEELRGGSYSIVALDTRHVYFQASSTARMLDPVEGTFTVLDAPVLNPYAPGARIDDTRALLFQNGVPGICKTPCWQAPVLFDRSTRSFTHVGEALFGHPIALPDGRVAALAGPLDGVDGAELVVFDAATMEMAKVARLEKFYGSMLSLPCGALFLSAASTTGINAHAGRVTTYDTHSRSFEDEGFDPPFSSTAQVLTDGTVLVVGGLSTRDPYDDSSVAVATTFVRH
jgi:hypothetical protein